MAQLFKIDNIELLFNSNSKMLELPISFHHTRSSQKFLILIKVFPPPCHDYTWLSPLPLLPFLVLSLCMSVINILLQGKTKTVFTEIPWSIADLFSAWFSMSFENHSLNSSWESKRVGMMKCSNAHSCYQKHAKQNHQTNKQPILHPLD